MPRALDTERELNPRELEFCRLYAAGETGTKSYLKAYGCAESGASKGSYQLLRKKKIQQKISEFLTGGMGFTPEWISQLMAKRAQDPTRTEQSQDRNADNCAKIIGVYKKEEVTDVKILNVTNIMNHLEAPKKPGDSEPNIRKVFLEEENTQEILSAPDEVSKNEV